MADIIVFDDTHSNDASRFLDANRKTWLAVHIKEEYQDELLKGWKIILDGLHKEFGINEIHLTDLVNKSGEFEGLDNEDVLSIIDIICELLYKFELPYLFQTFNPKTFEEHGITILGKKKSEDGFDVSNPDDMALLVLLLKIKDYIEESKQNTPIEFISDEGRMNPGRIHKINMLRSIAVDGGIKYESSRDNLFLQIADFYAYSLNRIQRTLVKENRTEFDIAILELIAEILQHNNISGGEVKNNIDIDNFSKDDYDYHLRSKWEIDNNLDNWLKSKTE